MNCLLPLNSLLRTLALVSLTLPMASSLQGGAFTLTEQNASGIGTAFSASAEAKDASTIFYNPAGLTRLDRQELVGAVNVIVLSGGYVDEGSTTAGFIPISGGNGGNPGGATPIPTLYYALPISDSLVAGFGMHVPFGLSTSYDEGWVGRYHGLNTELATINLNPSIGLKLTESLSIGFGFSYQYVEATFTNAIDFGLAGWAMEIPGFAPGSADGAVAVEGSNWGTGYNFGILWEPMAGARFGLAYRSQIGNTVTGDATFADVPAPFQPIFYDQGFTAALDLPASISGNFFYQVDSHWSVMADITWTNWDVLQEIVINFEDPLTPTATLPQHWNNSFIYSGGVHYSAGNLTYKLGLAFDETPIPSPEYRSPRIPDSDRTWVSFGMTFRTSETLSFDVGYAHLFMAEGPTNFTDDQTHNLKGTFNLRADVFSGQVTWKF
ncbi:MAG: aromatic hydrocarbon degradation protein [Verrucomicrobia bacterium]|nr:MAG: aromatic hydrocarbon degradation protein [Verrucomicrobiota bacterium]